MAYAIQTYGELKDGDIVTLQGYRFRAQNVRVSAVAGSPSGIHTPPHRADLIRFEGICIDDCDISRTGYNGGTYGAYADVSVCAMREQE